MEEFPRYLLVIVDHVDALGNYNLAGEVPSAIRSFRSQRLL